MTGNYDESDRFSHPSAEGNATLHSQQRSTPRALRFSQKLMNAAKKSPLARYPLATPTTSASLSPSLEPYMDDESMTDHNSCFSLSPQYHRDDPDLNCHLQGLVLSPLRRPAASTTESALTGGSSTSTPWRMDKRPQVPHRGSDSPSLSAKPKRRKLKQQRATAWRTGADAALDTNKIYAPFHEKQQQDLHHHHHQQQQSQSQSQYNYRRSARIADKRQQQEEQGPETLTRKPRRPLPVILGTPTGVKPSNSSTTIDSHTILLHDDDDDDDMDSQQRATRRRRPKVDFVEERLDKLLSVHDPLDLSHHSVIPKNHQGALAPVVIVLDEEEEQDLSTKVKSEPIDDIDVSSLPTATHLDIIDDDDEMIDGPVPVDAQQQQQQQSIISSTSHLAESSTSPFTTLITQVDDDDEMTDESLQQQQQPTPTSIPQLERSQISPTTQQEVIDDDKTADESSQQQQQQSTPTSTTQLERSQIVPTTQQEIIDDDNMANESSTGPTTTITTRQEFIDDHKMAGESSQQTTSTTISISSPSTTTAKQNIIDDDLMAGGEPQQQQSTPIRTSYLEGSPITLTIQQSPTAIPIPTEETFKSNDVSNKDLSLEEASTTSVPDPSSLSSPLDSASTNEPPPSVLTHGQEKTPLLSRLFGPVAHYLIGN